MHQVTFCAFVEHGRGRYAGPKLRRQGVGPFFPFPSIPFLLCSSLLQPGQKGDRNPKNKQQQEGKALFAVSACSTLLRSPQITEPIPWSSESRTHTAPSLEHHGSHGQQGSAPVPLDMEIWPGPDAPSFCFFGFRRSQPSNCSPKLPRLRGVEPPAEPAFGGLRGALLRAAAPFATRFSDFGGVVVLEMMVQNAEARRGPWRWSDVQPRARPTSWYDIHCLPQRHRHTQCRFFAVV